MADQKARQAEQAKKTEGKEAENAERVSQQQAQANQVHTENAERGDTKLPKEELRHGPFEKPLMRDDGGFDSSAAAKADRETAQSGGGSKLRFKRSVEVQINGVRYAGREVSAPDRETADEIVRLAKGSYGDDIVEGR